MKEKEIEFIGKVTAGVTHEVNNVLASIREISGLLTDILSITTTNSFPRKEKFQTSLQKIQNQVQRGVKLTSQLNKFSHLSDNDKADVDLNEIIEHLIFLTERFARLKDIALKIEPSNKSITINTNPFLLEMALFNCIAYLINNMTNGGEISICPGKDGNKYSINIICKGEVIDKTSIFKDSSLSEELLSLRNTMELLGGVFELDELTPGIIIRFPDNK
jgi:C4-dicarboxylate-specific signal transduction histidine kinase